jgi:hypothetical protein
MKGLRWRGRRAIIEWRDPEGRPRSVSFPDLTEDEAVVLRRHVNAILREQRTGLPIDGDTRDWIRRLNRTTAARLERVGLIEPAVAWTLGELLDRQHPQALPDEGASPGEIRRRHATAPHHRQ